MSAIVTKKEEVVVDISAVGRIELEKLYQHEREKVEKLFHELRAAAGEIETKGWRVIQLQKQVTELQTRGTELIQDARASKRIIEGLQLALNMHPLAPLLVALQKGREKYPNGVTAWSVVDEAGELAHAINKREGMERQKEEALDTAVVALRYFLGEIDRENEHGGLTLRGWSCRHCFVFNGEERETLHSCRSCGRPR